MKKDNILVITRKAAITEFTKAAAHFTRTKKAAERLVKSIIAGRKVRIPKDFRPIMWRFMDVIAAIDNAQGRAA